MKVKIIIEDTNLIDKELDNKIRERLKDKVQELDKNKRYTMDLEFCEEWIRCDYEIDSYVIPEEVLPTYQRGKELKGKDKMYQLLQYRVDSARNMIEGYGIILGSCNIKGSPFMELNNIELCFEEEEDDQLDISKRKKQRKITVTTIMPSLSGFYKNLMKASEYIEKNLETQLENAFDDKKEYDKYKSLELKTILIFEIPVYKITKKNSRINKSIGHIRLLTNGKTITVKFQPHSKSYAIPDEILERCFVIITSNEDNRKLLKIIKDFINKVEEKCQGFGYKLEKEVISNVLAYMDMKNVLKKAREA